MIWDIGSTKFKYYLEFNCYRLLNKPPFMHIKNIKWTKLDIDLSNSEEHNRDHVVAVPDIEDVIIVNFINVFIPISVASKQINLKYLSKLSS